MSAPITNRDLYRFACALQERADGMDRPLESYLLTLWSLTRPLRDEPAIPIGTFLRLLDEALTAPAPPFPETWRILPDPDWEGPASFARWEAVIIHQIRDLREMDAAGMPLVTGVYLLTSPRGSSWYNVGVGGYLEAAASATFGGWEIGDDPPGRLGTPVFPVREVTWENYVDFLCYGRLHE